jgi:hypothetical protein
MHESFLRHRDWRYLKVAAASCVLAALAYAIHDPLDGPNGGTWLGYTLGTIGTLIILGLTWLGVRKRQYGSRVGTVRGWVSAHVYFGLALILIVTLHTGFQFGLNVHTFTYALMILVIASGGYGVIAYSRYPRVITDNRSQATREGWLEELLDLNERAIRLGDEISPDVHRFVLRSAERLALGGGWRAQVFGPRQAAGAPEVTAIAEILRKKIAASAADRTDAEQIIMMTESRIMMSERDPTVERLKQLLELLMRRNELAARINRDVQAHGRMQIWLYLHVPLTGALLAALTAHIVIVFLYH